MSSANTSIIVNGATGRTGSRICALAQRDGAFTLVAALTHARSVLLKQPVPGAPPGATPLEFQAKTPLPADAVIDFSSDAGAREALNIALDRSAALLVGTTALSAQTLSTLRDESKKIPILVAPNTSIGVAALSVAVANLAAALGPSFSASIVEAHHTAKKDAPSGTALRLAAVIKQGGGDLQDRHILSIRAGDIVGEHTVRFTGHGESIELSHRVTTRDVFALGALRAAAWLRAQPPGWWTIEDVLGIARTGP